MSENYAIIYMYLQDTLYILKIKTKMRTIWKMKVSEKFYQEVIEETKQILKEFNQDHLVNWEEKTVTK